MKKIKKNFLLIIIIASIFSGCSKYGIEPNGKLSASDTSNYATDGILTIQASIKPPATPSTFLANKRGGATSFIAWDTIASKPIIIDRVFISGNYPSVNTIDGQSDSLGGALTFPSSIYTIQYKNVTAKTSPRIGKTSFTYIIYETEDHIGHNLTIDSISGANQPVCIVNNIAHITFRGVKYQLFPNGQSEVCEVLLTGDTSWILNSLPITCFSPDESTSSGTPTVVRYNKIVIARDSSINNQSVFFFKNGFQHHAGVTDTLKIYGNIFLPQGNWLDTELGDLNYFEWLDGVGGKITGNLNQQFYKEQTGIAYLHHN